MPLVRGWRRRSRVHPTCRGALRWGAWPAHALLMIILPSLHHRRSSTPLPTQPRRPLVAARSPVGGKHPWGLPYAALLWPFQWLLVHGWLAAPICQLPPTPLPHSPGAHALAGVTALYAAMHCPHVFGAVLAESPSLWIAEGRFLEEDLKRYRGPLPERIFIGCGACAGIASLTAVWITDNHQPVGSAVSVPSMLSMHCSAG